MKDVILMAIMLVSIIGSVILALLLASIFIFEFVETIKDCFRYIRDIINYYFH